MFADADTVATRTVAGAGAASGGRHPAARSRTGSVASNNNKKNKAGKAGGDFQSIFAESLGAGASALGESIDDNGMEDALGDGGDDDMGTGFISTRYCTSDGR